jgi:hypothetical protein
MLTNGFTCEEIGSCAPGSTLKCIAAVVMRETSEVTFTAGQEYKVESTSETLMVVKNDKGQRHMVYSHFFRRHFTVVATASARQVVHLSETGPHAGRRFCGASRDDGNRSVHAMYAPLHSPEFRQNVCRACLETWATEAYEEGGPMPEYIAEVRRGNQPTAGTPCVISSTPLALEMQ